MIYLPLRRLADCWDYLRVPLNAEERALRPGPVPYWGANNIQGHVDSALVSEEVVLIGEDGAPFFDRDRPVAFRVDEPIWPNNHIHVLKPHESVDARWLAYALNNVDYSLHVAGSTRDKLTQSSMMQIALPTPTFAIQRAIADYLDRETAQIDTLITKQEQLIATLRERRTTAVYDGVTGQVGTRVDRRPSTLGWVTHIPSHWEELNIRRVATMHTGHTPSRSTEAYWENTTIPWFTLADVWQLRDGRQTHLGQTANRISELGLANSAAELLPAETVVLSRTASVGFTGIMPEPMATSQDFWNWICGPRLLPEFLMLTFRAMRPYLLSLMIGSTHQTIYQPIAASIRIPLPPIAEQHEIAHMAFAEMTAIDTLIDKAEQFIALARERRSALITAAVTGQIEVPTAA